MRSSLRYYILLWGFVAGTTGCTTVTPWFSKPQPNDTSIKAPADRVLELREMAELGIPSDDAKRVQQSQAMGEEYRREGDPIVRAQLVQTLGPYPTPIASQILREALQDPDPSVRVQACRAWGKRGDEEAVNVLSRVLKHDEDIDSRIAATQALGQIKGQPSVQALSVALDDSDPALQYRAVRSLENVTGKDYGDNVNAWREYVSTGQPPQQGEQSVAQRFIRLFR